MHRGAIPPLAKRLAQLPDYLFLQIDALKEKIERQGREVIDMGVGDPDRPTPEFIRKALIQALKDPRNHRYPTNRGLQDFRVAIAGWYRRRFGVALDPEEEILPLIGSKEGIAHLPLAWVNPGDKVLIPNPGYPPYRTGTILASGRPVEVPLRSGNQFLPDLTWLKKKTQGAKLLFLNYPNNPTAAVATLDFFRDLVRWAQETGVPICHDAAYSEITFDGFRAPSFLEVTGAKEVGIEFHSLSKTFNMTGWRVGFVCGNRKMVQALAKVKSNIDSGIFQAIQWAAVRALNHSGDSIQQTVRLYRLRRNRIVQALQRAGCPIEPPKATFYLWAPLLTRGSSRQAAQKLLRKAGIVATPGIGFGRYGEGYIRFSLSLADDRIQEAARRIQRIRLWRGPSSD